LGFGLYFALGGNLHKEQTVIIPSAVVLLDARCGLLTALPSLRVGILNWSNFLQ